MPRAWKYQIESDLYLTNIDIFSYSKGRRGQSEMQTQENFHCAIQSMRNGNIFFFIIYLFIYYNKIYNLYSSQIRTE